MSAQRNFAIDLIEHLVRILGALHGREHIPRSDCADPNLRRQFQRHRSRQLNHTCFGRIVIGVVRVAHDSIGGGCLQNHAAAPLPHMTCRGLRDVEHAREVYGDDLVPFFGCDVKKIVADADAGIVDDDVHAAQDAHRIGKRRLHLL